MQKLVFKGSEALTNSPKLIQVVVLGEGSHTKNSGHLNKVLGFSFCNKCSKT